MKTLSVQAPVIPSPPPIPQLRSAETASGPKNFVDLLASTIQEVNSLQSASESSVEDLLTGRTVDSAEVLTAVQKADMAFRMLQQVRNKLVDAYREINQMQI